ncbi:PIN domain nuclease of toxin-antitoxin system [Arthrobacter pigmenti]|uniref:PIN domain nuclease of toxin-antitoxin system n=1 Tax=Arthrobacter pigmenti TaxID=271432 RepID=A0A846RSH0_9MICC|nr:type II toxin-antitoxin system VapC family toxin [Arthrobacter pigmenti]NJC23492.1 PIN domain nuclease of toxin-antitoxin system [Arthrobacter pigmenti]
MGTTTYLIDSQALLLAMTSPRSLSSKARKIISSMDETLLASAATAYELAYKYRKGKLPGLDRVFIGYEHHVRRVAPLTVPITTEHALTAASLVWNHADPFDRLIAAQAMVEGATIITSDNAMHEFEALSTVW